MWKPIHHKGHEYSTHYWSSAWYTKLWGVAPACSPTFTATILVSLCTPAELTLPSSLLVSCSFCFSQSVCQPPPKVIIYIHLKCLSSSPQVVLDDHLRGLHFVLTLVGHLTGSTICRSYWFTGLFSVRSWATWKWARSGITVWITQTVKNLEYVSSIK